MSNLTDVTSSVADRTTDLLEKVSSPASRSGSVVERSGKMTEQGVDPEVTALQMTKNSPNGQKYTAQDVDSYAKLYQDSETRVVLTAKQARALIKDQQESTLDATEFAPQI
ncbi:hypothetical protein ACJO2E_03385 [Marinobacter sp. M1N3S26]|uniref:hypothetical protein n=1 Tax=Marinobacter sp. M1N3S26 TaxID=3382299 RepID=UPI00387B29C8